MNAPTEPRKLSVRIADTRARLEHDIDCWVATASPNGVPTLVPLSFDWIDGVMLLATNASHPTARNVDATGRIAITLGNTRDVVVITASAEVVALDSLPPETLDHYCARAGWDPRRFASSIAILVRPTTVQAWREVNELSGRTLMRDGTWLTAVDR